MPHGRQASIEEEFAANALKEGLHDRGIGLLPTQEQPERMSTHLLTYAQAS